MALSTRIDNGNSHVMAAFYLVKRCELIIVCHGRLLLSSGTNIYSDGKEDSFHD